jgi:hypothetical protein
MIHKAWEVLIVMMVAFVGVFLSLTAVVFTISTIAWALGRN